MRKEPLLNEVRDLKAERNSSTALAAHISELHQVALIVAAPPLALNEVPTFSHELLGAGRCRRGPLELEGIEAKELYQPRVDVEKVTDAEDANENGEDLVELLSKHWHDVHLAHHGLKRSAFDADEEEKVVAKRRSQPSEERRAPEDATCISVVVGVEAIPAGNLQPEDAPEGRAHHVAEGHHAQHLRRPEAAVSPEEKR
mmetsp:Transcript_20771/g.45710  ORF Transcript_20771/g.45710 Transcript_20771/m.45710 type:complete len:200 (-) Transcript_20771:1252-1851(-)